MDSLIGKTLGPYQILEPIGHGGMAAVYKAYQPALERYVAIKVLPAQLATAPGFAQRFQREAKAVARLEHPHILPVHDFGQQDDLSYIVMRYVEAGTLKDLMGKPLPLMRISELVGEIAAALDYAHKQGVVHRDVKPANVLIDPQGEAFLTDFGVARIVEATQQLTGTGVGVGTPAYMSPEQGQGKPADGRSDVYSLGVVLYEMLTGQVPYQAETPIAVVLKHINDPLPIPRQVNPAIPERVQRVVLKALAKSPRDRYQTAGEMAKALREAVQGKEEVEVRPIAEGVIHEGIVVPPAPRVSLERLRRLWWVAPVILAAGAGAILVTSGLLAGGSGTAPTAMPPTELLEATSATPAGAAVPVDPTIYDDFNDPAYEGRINTGIWVTEADCSDVAQEDGAMVFRTASSMGGNECDLVLGRPTLMPFAQMGVLEARLKIAADRTGDWVTQTLDLVTDDLPGGMWVASCGMVGAKDGAHHQFLVQDYGANKPAEVSQLVPADFGRWYTIRFEVDPALMLFTCLADDQLVGSVIPRDAADLADARVKRNTTSYRDANSYATTYADDVRFILAEKAPQATVPALPTAAPSAPVPYMTPLPGADSTHWQHLTFNLEDSIVGDLAIRQAIAYGTFRQALGDAWVPPYSPVILNSYIRPDSPYYAGDANLTLYPYDLERAKSILEKAGWIDTDGDGIRERDGVPLALRYVTTELPERRTLALAFETQMRAIGIDVAVEILTNQVMGDALYHGEFQLAQFAWKEETEEFIPTGAFVEGCENSFLHSACIPTISNGWKGVNISRLQSAEMDRLLEELLRATTFDERRALLIQTQALFTRELPVLPLFCNPQE